MKKIEFKGHDGFLLRKLVNSFTSRQMMSLQKLRMVTPKVVFRKKHKKIHPPNGEANQCFCCKQFGGRPFPESSLFDWHPKLCQPQQVTSGVLSINGGNPA